LPLRSVSVTWALEPSPPLRQDCHEIFSPSTGAASVGAAASTAAATKVARVGVLIGSGVDAFCATITADGAVVRSLLAPLGPESMPHVTNPINTTMESTTRLVLRFAKAAHFGRSLRPAGRIISAQDGSTSIAMAMPSTGGQTGTAAPPHSTKPRGRRTARLLKRLSICAVSPLFPQSTKPEMVASKRSKIGGLWCRRRTPRGMAMRYSGR
jgi:hypothetical protein